jgi:ABC-type proline/glycine betaine transport system substrate-binding protein
LPAGKSRESAISSFVSRLSYSAPDVAAPWANAIADDNQRYNQIENVARNWLRSDPQSAKAWLAGTSLPEERKVRILKSAPN